MMTMNLKEIYILHKYDNTITVTIHIWWNNKRYNYSYLAEQKFPPLDTARITVYTDT